MFRNFFLCCCCCCCRIITVVLALWFPCCRLLVGRGRGCVAAADAGISHGGQFVYFALWKITKNTVVFCKYVLRSRFFFGQLQFGLKIVCISYPQEFDFGLLKHSSSHLTQRISTPETKYFHNRTEKWRKYFKCRRGNLHWTVRKMFLFRKEKFRINIFVVQLQ